MNASDSKPRPSERRVVLGRLGRAALFCAGLGLTAWLVRAAGLARVLDAIHEAGRWLPALVCLEMGIVVTDWLASRSLLREEAPRITRATWTRATALAYASSVLLPAGRAAGEAVRAATLAPAVGVGAAAAACSRLQASVLIGNAVASAAGGAVVGLAAVSPTLTASLLGNSLLCAALGVGIFALARSERLARILRARFARFVAMHAPSRDSASPRPVLPAILLSVVGRGLQTVQYGLVLYAIGATSSPRAALTAQGIHLVGATVGDAVPNQMGAMEGAYSVFAGALGLAAAPARALSIALIVRIAQATLAVTCLVIATFVPRQRPAEAP